MNPTVSKVEFVYPHTLWDGQAKAVLKFSDGSEDSISFYHDELQFVEADFLGKTMDECRAVYHQKDIEYLRS